MVKKIKKIILDLSNGIIDEKKVITIAKEDNKSREKYVYYIQNTIGNTRLSKKRRIRYDQYTKLENIANNIKILKTY